MTNKILDGARKEAIGIAYLISAIDDIESAVELTEGLEQYNKGLFHGQQACEKAMKASLALKEIFLHDEHDISGIFLEKVANVLNGNLKNALKKLLPKIEEIESYYHQLMYPVSKEGEIFMDNLKGSDVSSAIDTADKLINITFEIFEDDTGKNLPDDKEKLKEYLKKEYKEYIKDA